MNLDDPIADPRPPAKEPETPHLVLARIVHRLGYLADQAGEIDWGPWSRGDHFRLIEQGIERLQQIRAAIRGEGVGDG